MFTVKSILSSYDIFSTSLRHSCLLGFAQVDQARLQPSFLTANCHSSTSVTERPPRRGLPRPNSHPGPNSHILLSVDFPSCRAVANWSDVQPFGTRWFAALEMTELLWDGRCSLLSCLRRIRASRRRAPALWRWDPHRGWDHRIFWYL